MGFGKLKLESSCGDWPLRFRRRGTQKYRKAADSIAGRFTVDTLADLSKSFSNWIVGSRLANRIHRWEIRPTPRHNRRSANKAREAPTWPTRKRAAGTRVGIPAVEAAPRRDAQR
ncbi:hypothetical protein SKAU_G00266460 [Synaphobranchus kaupii]|uniref:Uncharacterized protein n=1 Tax=Synaphobranchus kaupii TaxID=118154 RepID=A0A9Q1EZF0_SYNKA|nr:hypothetical protein SKAU_G00266460 [Synaphobranchus kaupii]